MRRQVLGVDYGIGASASFMSFLQGLENVGLKVSHRSYEDEQRVLAMGGFVHALAPWKVFATFTFSFSASVRSATKCFEKFVRRNIPNVSVFFAIEMHPGGHGGHVHALFDCLRFPRRALWQEWKRCYGINRIELIDGYQNVCDYCSKYVVKDQAWWNFSLNPAAWAKFTETKEFLAPLLRASEGREKFVGHGPVEESLGFSESSTPPPQEPRAVSVTNNGGCDIPGFAVGRAGCRVLRVRDILG